MNFSWKKKTQKEKEVKATILRISTVQINLKASFGTKERKERIIINSYSNEFFQVTKLTMAARIHGIHEKR